MSDEQYNGWTNRETWLVNLWLTNDAGMYEGALQAATADGEMLQEAAQSVEDYASDLIDGQFMAGFPHDLMLAAVARVNWLEVASSLREA